MNLQISLDRTQAQRNAEALTLKMTPWARRLRAAKGARRCRWGYSGGVKVLS
ncbi:MAG: hypothetical protein RRB13_02655 [bacterium]|nr:hypothetical protein [bacterium]